MRGLLALVLFLLLGQTHRAIPVTFYDLGTLEGGWSSSASSVNFDGSLIAGTSSFRIFPWGVGSSSVDGQGAFLWSPATGIESLAPMEGGPESFSTAISHNGSVVVGGNGTAFRWTRSGGMQNLGILPGGTGSYATGVNSDGTVIGGVSFLSGGGERGFVWTAMGGLQALSTPSSLSPVHLQNWDYSRAYGVSANGAVLVGMVYSSSDEIQAVRWTGSGDVQEIITPRGGSARAANFDGSVVVGASLSSNDVEAGFIWTESGGLQDLGFLAGGNTSLASSVSGDGSLVVGSSNSSEGFKAFIWDAENGMQDLNIYLAGKGIDLAGWTLRSAEDISLDGKTVVGYGTLNGETRAFAVSGVPEPASFNLILLGGVVLMAGRRRNRQKPISPEVLTP